MQAVIDLSKSHVKFVIAESDDMQNPFAVQIHSGNSVIITLSGEHLTLGLHTAWYGPAATHHCLKVLQRYYRRMNRRDRIRYPDPPSPSEIQSMAQKHWTLNDLYENPQLNATGFEYAGVMTLVITQQQYERLLFQLALAEYINPLVGALLVRSLWFSLEGELTEQGQQHKRQQRQMLKAWIHDSALPGLGRCRTWKDEGTRRPSKSKRPTPRSQALF